MAAPITEYSVNDEISTFFNKLSATRSDCDARAIELTSGSAVPIEVQGVCSYTVYAGHDLEYVVQFRLKSLELKAETSALARKVYGSLAPNVSFEGEIGGEVSDKESLYIYVMDRIKGIIHLDFILATEHPENSPGAFAYRRNLIVDVAEFFALSWNAPQPINAAHRNHLQERYTKELRLLHTALPKRLQAVIQTCLDSVEAILSLPMVLLHRDFGACNIMVDEVSCHLVGVVDWAEAEVCSFGLNLHSMQALTGKLHFRDGWSRYDDYSELQSVFWSTFQEKVGVLSEETMNAIKRARIMGLLLSRGFTSRLANEPRQVPIRDDQQGHYNMLFLDGFLIDAATKFD